MEKERYIYSKRVIVKFARKEYTDELKEIILLDTLFVQSKNVRYYDKANELKWDLAVEIVDYFGYEPKHEEYSELCDRIDFILGNYVESQTTEILGKVLDNIEYKIKYRI